MRFYDPLIEELDLADLVVLLIFIFFLNMKNKTAFVNKFKCQTKPKLHKNKRPFLDTVSRLVEELENRMDKDVTKQKEQ